MHFRNETHEKNYEAMLKRDKTRTYDYERQSLFYLLSTEPFLSRIDDLYDFEDHSITLYKSGNILDGICEKTACTDFTATERMIIACAYYLFNGYSDNFLTLTNMFGCNNEITLSILTAIKKRYSLNITEL